MSSQVDAVQHVGEHQLGAQIERNDVEIACRPVGIDREQRQLGGPHLTLEVGPWRVRTLSHGIWPLIQQLVQNL